MMDKIQKVAYTYFNKSSWLADEGHYNRFMEWNTFFRRNIALFAITYLGISLHFYQILILYLAQAVSTLCLVAARGSAKSFLIALYTCIMAILYPGSKIVIAAANKNQSRLIVTEKIQGELMRASPMLRREIKRVRDGTNNSIIVEFRNGSTITAVLAHDRNRGYRATILVLEEFRQIEKSVYDSVLSPFLMIRQPSYFTSNPQYSTIPELKEEPREVFISSAWRQSHWMMDIIKNAANDMFEGKDSCLAAFDYSVTLKYGLKSRKQLEREKKKADPITWMIEYQNIMVSDSAASYFSYASLASRQVLKKAFYPRRQGESFKSKLIAPIARQEGEIRILSCDIAMMDGAANDNSCFVCLRMLPEVNQQDADDGAQFGYRIQVPYLETRHGDETVNQTVRIKQLMYDWDADYVVLDVRNFGLSIYDAGARVLYDEERGIEYKPWKCMNNPEIAKRINNRADKENIYCVIGSSKFNNDVAVNLRQLIMDNKIEFLINPGEAAGFLMYHQDGYATASGEAQMFYDMPYLETAQMINETANLEYERLENGLIRIHEVGKARKDRYSALGYGCYFAAEIERDMYYDGGIDLSNMQGFVSALIL